MSLVRVRQCENADLTRAEERHQVRVLEAGSETDLPLESPSRQASGKRGGCTFTTTLRGGGVRV